MNILESRTYWLNELPLPENPKNLNHLNRYMKFILTRPERKNRNDFNFSLEEHHILPESMEGIDCEGNMILLTLREHFIAHMILFYCGYSEMVFAFWYISNNYNKISSRIYEKIKKEIIEFRKKDNVERFWINNEIEEKFIKKEEFEQYENFKIGRLKKEKYTKRGHLQKTWVFKDDKEYLCDFNDR